ncbi:FAS1-like dehydratase domain-containing protein [Paraburkholderia acidisoli]|uniref:Acyl-CoA dehydrogenase n=1 Tax=Paraburkholderia acidisoli TaxID=2571748 RepID=A0A7Z2JJ90_9BURK|nr:MaoC family dehydratase N-terminal domain-containing protein [Paraburkholderia acidisoli]QGZ65135.1 acyl-CoA dehydrogenase [Paraburkholderia acidisoli]
MDIDYLKQWIGRSETRTDTIAPTPIDALNALLDRDDAPAAVGDAVPPLWHWMYFLPIVRSSQVGADGHPMRGGFLPPVPLPRRMIAGGRINYTHALRVGDVVTRHARILAVEHKQGRTGDLVFVTVRNEFSTERGMALAEEQDIVYREVTPPGAAPAAPAQLAPASHLWDRKFTPDEVILFKFSALTLNGHRIHYDHPYVTQVEGYPGLIVHGPLIAILLADLVRRHVPQRSVARLTYRGIHPTFNTGPFLLCGSPEGETGALLWSRSLQGELTMQASATFR